MYPRDEPWAVPEVWQVTVPRSAAARLAAAGVDGGPGLPGVPDERVTLALDVRPWLDAKWAAVRAHRSEFERGARIAAMADPVLRELFLGTEHYIQRPGPAAGEGRSTGQVGTDR